ncbi:hypothetical protein Syun_021694 [Stephania yunnanensis]|uniref:Bifunctional inhibitor/plant lipid transfer protein/seed storage helical domain-containing protein n=1 Tax=Stephania yunnanensis TaxID=152371 RepID=A0AAP0IGG5_9MAGN
MAFPSPSPTSCALLMSQILLLLVSLSNAFLANHPDASGMVDCGPRLLRLAPCLPFVQGALPLPPQPCCDNLLDIFNELPSCLCTLLNSSTIITFPINRTLALQLPALCNLSMNSSSCPGSVSLPGSAPLPGSASLHDPEGNNANASTKAGSPTAAVAPTFNMGLGIGRSTGTGLQIGGSLLFVIAAWLLEVFSLI